jgi:hypothetical protein
MSALIPFQIIGLGFSLYMYLVVASRSITQPSPSLRLPLLWAFATLMWGILLAVTIRAARALPGQ